jgi:glutaredoxin
LLVRRVAGVNEGAGNPAPAPRRLWLLGVVGAVVAAGIGWSAYRRRGGPRAEVTTGNGVPQLLDFGMDICDQCKKTRALLHRLEPEFAGKVQIQYIDVREDANEALMQKYGLRVIPLLVLLGGDGRELWRHEGFAPEPMLREHLTRAVQQTGATSSSNADHQGARVRAC